MPTVETFARSLLRDLTRQDARAAHLRTKARGKTATIGMDEGDTWVPLFRLSSPSASCNVMNLDARHGDGWAPTFERGTPAMLAAHLGGQFLFIWADQVDAILAWRQTSDQRH